MSPSQPAPTSPSYLRPPAGQNKVGVDVLLSELLGDVEPQRAVFVVDVLLGGVAQDGVSVVDFLKLFSCVRVVWVLVRVKLQRQFPVKRQREERICKNAHKQTQEGFSVAADACIVLVMTLMRSCAGTLKLRQLPGITW